MRQLNTHRRYSVGFRGSRLTFARGTRHFLRTYFHKICHPIRGIQYSITNCLSASNVLDNNSHSLHGLLIIIEAALKLCQCSTKSCRLLIFIFQKKQQQRTKIKQQAYLRQTWSNHECWWSGDPDTVLCMNQANHQPPYNVNMAFNFLIREN